MAVGLSVAQQMLSQSGGMGASALDVLTPAGVSQATELDPTLGPVAIQGVAIP